MSELAKSALPGHDVIHRRVADRIVADLRPVQRLWPVSARLALWVALEMSMLLFVIHITHRTDLGKQITDPWYLSGAAGLAFAGAIGAALALRAAIPGREPRPLEIILLIAVVIGSALPLLHEPFQGNVPVTKFIQIGSKCALEVFVCATVPFIALLWAIRRGTPLAPGLNGALIGASAFLLSFALMRVLCPIDEELHLFTWHLVPALAGIALSAGVGLLLLKKRVKRI